MEELFSIKRGAEIHSFKAIPVTKIYDALTKVPRVQTPEGSSSPRIVVHDKDDPFRDFAKKIRPYLEPALKEAYVGKPENKLTREQIIDWLFQDNVTVWNFINGTWDQDQAKHITKDYASFCRLDGFALPES